MVHVLIGKQALSVLSFTFRKAIGNYLRSDRSPCIPETEPISEEGRYVKIRRNKVFSKHMKNSFKIKVCKTEELENCRMKMLQQNPYRDFYIYM